MATVGRVASVLALAVAVYGAVAAVWGAARRKPLLVESARVAAYPLLAMVGAATLAMLAALLANDFSIAYVALNSSRDTPTFFKVLALWSADQGSLLLWNLVLAAFIAAMAHRFRRKRADLLPWALTVLFVVAAFYLSLIAGPADPFATLPVGPSDGRGPLPLLQNHPLMAVHPPLLYLGFVGMTVPFAFAMGTLITGDRSDGWISVTRPWLLTAWVFLTAGLAVGALWSYGVLGWGGYWAWDPVENVALLPWLLGTAFLHSAKLEERRGLLRTWNLSLVVGTFALVTLGTFLTRGSILASVHAFADSAVGPMYLGFLVVVLVAGFGAIAWRSGATAVRGRLDSALSREAAFLGNNLALTALAFVILVGTIFPLFVEAVTGRRITVGEPYFTETTTPLFLLLLFLSGVGVLLPWRRGSAEDVRARLTAPAVAGAAAMVALVAVGVRHVAAVAALGLAAMVVTSNVRELGRGIRAHRRSGGTATGAVARNPRLYGGLVAHLGVALTAAAVTTSSAFVTEREVTLDRDEAVTIDDYSLRFEGIRLLDEPHRDVVVADVAVRRDGRPDGAATPSLNLYPGASQPIGTPAIRHGITEDLYVSFVGFEERGARAAFRLYLTPGVSWLWVGAAFVVAGGALALRPPNRPPRPRPGSPAGYRVMERVG